MRQDAEMALSIMRRKEKMDKHYQTHLQQTLQGMALEDYVQRASFFLPVGRHVERAGDRAANVAERVVLVTTGEFVRTG